MLHHKGTCMHEHTHTAHTYTPHTHTHTHHTHIHTHTAYTHKPATYEAFSVYELVSVWNSKLIIPVEYMVQLASATDGTRTSKNLSYAYMNTNTARYGPAK